MKLWIARDVCNIRLKLFFEKPVEQEGNWVVKHIDKLNRMYYWNFISIDNDLFQEVTFENSPREAEIKLVDEIVGVAESPLKTFPRINEFEVGAGYRR